MPKLPSASSSSTARQTETGYKTKKKNKDKKTDKTNNTKNNVPKAYSSEHYTARQIREENIYPAHNQRAPRQVFDVTRNDAPNRAMKALVLNHENQSSMAIMTHSLDKQYQLQGGETIRPVTPRLTEQFKNISDTRIRLSSQDLQRYRALAQDYRNIVMGGGITLIPAAQAHQLRINAIDVDMGETKVIVHSPGSQHVLFTSDVCDCIAIGATAHTTDGRMVLGLTHYNGTDMHTQESIAPSEQLRRLSEQMKNPAPGVTVRPETLSVFLSGAEASPEYGSANHIEDEREMLAFSEVYFAHASARFYTVKVDTNANNDTIQRYTDDEHSNDIDVLLTPRGMVITRGQYNLTMVDQP